MMNAGDTYSEIDFLYNKIEPDYTLPDGITPNIDGLMVVFEQLSKVARPEKVEADVKLILSCLDKVTSNYLRHGYIRAFSNNNQPVAQTCFNMLLSMSAISAESNSTKSDSLEEQTSQILNSLNSSSLKSREQCQGLIQSSKRNVSALIHESSSFTRAELSNASTKHHRYNDGNIQAPGPSTAGNVVVSRSDCSTSAKSDNSDGRNDRTSNSDNVTPEKPKLTKRPSLGKRNAKERVPKTKAPSRANKKSGATKSRKSDTSNKKASAKKASASTSCKEKKNKITKKRVSDAAEKEIKGNKRKTSASALDGTLDRSTTNKKKTSNDSTSTACKENSTTKTIVSKKESKENKGKTKSPSSIVTPKKASKRNMKAERSSSASTSKEKGSKAKKNNAVCNKGKTKSPALDVTPAKSSKRVKKAGTNNSASASLKVNESETKKNNSVPQKEVRGNKGKTKSPALDVTPGKSSKRVKKAGTDNSASASLKVKESETKKNNLVPPKEVRGNKGKTKSPALDVMSEKCKTVKKSDGSNSASASNKAKKADNADPEKGVKGTKSGPKSSTSHAEPEQSSKNDDEVNLSEEDKSADPETFFSSEEDSDLDSEPVLGTLSACMNSIRRRVPGQMGTATPPLRIFLSANSDAQSDILESEDSSFADVPFKLDDKNVVKRMAKANKPKEISQAPVSIKKLTRTPEGLKKVMKMKQSEPASSDIECSSFSDDY